MSLKTDLENLIKSKQLILEQIRLGQSTGDKLTDFLLVWHDGHYDAKLEHHYRSFLDQLDSHQGEQVQVTYHQLEKSLDEGCYVGESIREQLVCQELGIIQEKSSFTLSGIKGGILTIPTKNYVSQGSLLFRKDDDKWTEHNGDINVPVIYLSSLNNLDQWRSIIHNPVNYDAELIVGNKKVALYNLLGKELFHKTISRNTCIDTALKEVIAEGHLRKKHNYTYALQLLGIEIPELLK